MKIRLFLAAALASVSLTAGSVSALTLVEEFNNPFPDWENDWLGSNSNIKNYYGVAAGRGNQPNGLWVEDTLDDGVIDVAFDLTFGSLWTDFSIDVATFVANNILTVYDVSGATLASFSGFQNNSYDDTLTYSVSSGNGIGGFKFSSTSASGNTWIDNVTLSDGASAGPAPVPLPAGLPLLAAAVGAIGIAARKQRNA